jgi:hypothetical protein
VTPAAQNLGAVYSILPLFGAGFLRLRKEFETIFGRICSLEFRREQ